MLALDMRTVLLSFMLCNALNIVVMVSLWRSQPAPPQATPLAKRLASPFALFAAWAALGFVGFLLLALRGHIADLLSIVVANALIMGGGLVLLVALERYLGRTRPQRWNLSLLLVFVAIHLHYTVVDPSLSARNINIAVYLMIIGGQIAWLCLRRVDVAMRPATTMCGLIMLLLCVVSVLRIVIGLRGDAQQDAMRIGTADTAVVLAYQMLSLAMSFSLFRLVHGRQQLQLQADVSALEASQEQLRTSEARLQRAEAAAAMGHWELHLKTRQVLASDGAARVYGLDAARLDDNTIKAIPLPQGRQQLDAAVARLVADGTPYDLEFEIRRPDTGEIRHVRSRASIDAERRIIFGIIQDITQRKLVDDGLRLAASVFTHAGEGIIIADAQGMIVEVNQAFTRITGYSAQEARGQSPRMLQSGRHPPEFYRAMWQSLADTGLWRGEIWNRRKSGEVYVEMLTISRVDDDAGQVRNYVALFADITSLKEHERQLEQHAYYDLLTSLPNRVLLGDRLRQALAQSERRQQSLAVVFLDLDGFKAVNDAHGHAVGDELLVAMSIRLKAALRQGDTLARLGGDEFVALLLDLQDQADCTAVVSRMLEAAATPFDAGGAVLKVSASIGVALYPQHGNTAELLLHRADQAMYDAKRAGRNRFQIGRTGDSA